MSDRTRRISGGFAVRCIRWFAGVSYEKDDAKRGIVNMSGEWISVTTRLPECGVDVLVYAGAKEYEGGYHVCYWEKSNPPSMVDGWFSREDLKIFWDVTHWMPLPAPPADAK